MNIHDTQIQRLGYEGDLDSIIKQAAAFYGIGEVVKSQILAEGYEDFNIRIDSTQGSYVCKFFANNQLGDYSKTRRGIDVVERLVEILQAGETAQVNSPRLRRSLTGEAIFRNDSGLPAIMYDWIDGSTYYDLQTVPTQSELEIILEHAAKFNAILLKPLYYHDIWAVVHIHALYQKMENFLAAEEKQLMGM